MLSVVVGVVSYGLAHCGDGPSVYTNLVYFMKWILDSLYSVEETTEEAVDTRLKYFNMFHE